MKQPILKTKRLTLRPLRLEDASRIQELFPHWDIVKYMAPVVPWPYPPDGARQFLQEIALPAMAAEREYNWAITLGDDRLIGIIGLHTERAGDHRGFWLAQQYQKQGYMKEAMRAVTDFAFFKLGLKQLEILNAEPNAASHRRKEISGARIVKYTDNVDYVGGKFRQVHWLLTREDWEMHRKNF